MGTLLFVLTGSSRGLGAAVADRLAVSGHTLLRIARRNDAAFDIEAKARGADVVTWNLDLAQPVEAAARLEAWLAAFDAANVDSATLINNAALLSPAGPLDASTNDEISTALRVGLEAPLLLTAAFLRTTRGWRATKRILDISSGLGRRAMAGQAPYCAVKAGLDHHARAIALDEARRPDGARIVSLAPGVIDTDMQVALRSADPARFPDCASFVGLKQNGQLASSADAAARVLAYLERPDFGTNPVADVRDA